LIGGWNFFSVSLGPKILILKSIRGQIIFNFHGLLKDEEAIDWKGGFSKLPLDKGNKLKERSWEIYQGVDGVCFFLSPKKRRRRSGERKH
jgi:hypothetical protein